MAVKKHHIGAYTASLLALVLLAAVSLELARRSANPPAFLEALINVEATAPPETVPPELHGVKDIVIGLCGSPAYRAGVSATGGAGEATLEVDSAGVDTNTPGEYTVIYIARDAAGNETRREARVTVTSVTEEQLRELADPILEEILLPGMSDTEKALAIHTWVHGNIAYTNTGEKDSVLDGAYNALHLRYGDCYTFYALGKYFLARAGIETIDMRRVPQAETKHFWLLLNLGEGWRHFDTCPVLREHAQDRARYGFMMTQAEANHFAEAYDRPDYYSFPPECLPEGVEIVP